MSQITIIDNQFYNQYNHIITTLSSMRTKYFRDVPSNIIIHLYNIIYLYEPTCLTNKYSIIDFISSNKKTISILTNYMDNRNNINQLYRTDSTTLNSSTNSIISQNKYKQIANYIRHLHRMI